MSLSRLLSQQAHTIEPPSLRAITAKVLAVNGINLGQGVCQLPVPDEVLRGAYEALAAGINRYTHPRGLKNFREVLAKKLLHFNKITADPEREIFVTSGTTGAFEAVCAALLNPGDEVVSFSPRYPYHHNMLRRYKARCVYVELKAPSWHLDLEALERAFSSKTKFILINTPANPTGKVFSRVELEAIAALCNRYDCLAVTDEIYEYLTYDGHEHISPASLPELRERTITIGGYSKTFSITGWRIGYMVAPEVCADALTSILDTIFVCAPAPLQQACASAVQELPDEFYSSLCRKYEHKRNLFVSAIREAGFEPISPSGAYYVLADYSAIRADLPSNRFVDWMIEKSKVGAVPAIDFIDDATDARWVRFCCAVEDDILEKAAAQLRMLARS